MQEALKIRLKSDEFKLTDEHIAALDAQGVDAETDMGLLTGEEFTKAGCNLITTRKLIAAFGPKVATPPAGSDKVVDINADIPDDKQPTPAAVNSFATQFGMDPSMLTLMMMGGMSGAAGSAMDISGLIPVEQMVSGYNPKVRNMFLMVLSQVQDRHGCPIIVINEDGSVNKDLTTEYINGLDEGRDPADNDVYFDTASNPYQIIKVGVDAQSIYDADPLNSTKALAKNGMGTGNVNWHDVPLEVRQVCFYAVQTGEIDPTNDGHMTWLRDKIKPNVKRLIFSAQAPKAVAAFNEAFRSGSLPTLRVMLTRGPRSKEFMTRRRSANITG